MFNGFEYGWKDEETGLFIQAIYWTTGSRCYKRYVKGGCEGKAKRISEQAYIQAYESYKNY